jgi:hypothetical protein
MILGIENICEEGGGVARSRWLTSLIILANMTRDEKSFYNNPLRFMMKKAHFKKFVLIFLNSK